ncbi:cytochrome P450 [Nocardia sp. NBC_01499]|uniref:cytochrome P450 n=1 Tax=Nocardia sp. NBC_01499 TaxID=2903597 RepID=UPI00386C63F9
MNANTDAAVVLSGYEDVFQVLRGPGWSSDPSRFTDAPAATRDIPPSMLILMDPPGHTRLRRLLRPSFTRRAIEQAVPNIAVTVDSILDGLGAEFDILADYAEIVPLAVMADLMDVGAEGAALFRAHTPNLVKILEVDSTADDLAATFDAAFDVSLFLTPLILERADRPGNDFISSIVEHSDLTVDEVLSVCILLLAAGQDSVAHTICNSVLALLEHPDQLGLLHADPKRAVEELLRLNGSIRLLKRMALVDQRVGDRVIPAGTTVILDLHGANTDPAAYPDPHRLDLGRPYRGHVAFGKGPHVCLGAALARVQMIEALTRLFTRFPAIRPAAAELQWRTSASVYGLRELPVRVDGAPPRS